MSTFLCVTFLQGVEVRAVTPKTCIQVSPRRSQSNAKDVLKHATRFSGHVPECQVDPIHRCETLLVQPKPVHIQY
jgi:hypothetical protein